METLSKHTNMGVEALAPTRDGSLIRARVEGNVEKGESGVVQMRQSNLLQGGDPLKPPQSIDPFVLESSENLSNLHNLNEQSVLQAIRLRYSQRKIYTYSGIVLIAINPFSDVDSLDLSRMVQAYAGKPRTAQEPHLFAVAEEAFADLARDGTNQTIVVSGESGAGKTVSAQYIMRYFATRTSLQPSKPTRAGRADTISQAEERILAANPIMEAFGNAKTTRNDNSSRFGKYIQIMFDERKSIIGAKIKTYLLERSRIVSQASMERNYHIFYQLVAGADDDLRRKLDLRPVEGFHYLNRGGTQAIDGVDDKAEFDETRKSLAKVGLSERAQGDIFRVLAALLHLGNVTIGTTRGEATLLPSDPPLERACQMLGVDLDRFRTFMIQKQLATRGENITSSLTPQQATIVRDSVAKFLYKRLFDWLINEINTTLASGNVEHPRHAFIGVLDIFGFEHFDKNSLEQFCINYANEKLQQGFTQRVLKLEQEEYVQQEINWTFIKFSDNQPCIDLIEGKRGILSLLEAQSRLPGGSDQRFVAELHEEFGKFGIGKDHHKFYRKPRTGSSAFTVCHYAVDVEYESDGFIEKNRDAVPDEHLEVLRDSTNQFIKSILNTGQATGEKSSTTMLSKSAGVASGRRSGVSISQKRTLGSIFKDSLAELMKTMDLTNVHYIRCIKPNEGKEAWKFEAALVLRQLKACGVLETVRISTAGYPGRRTYEEFASRYYMLCDWSERKCTSNARDICDGILRKAMSEIDHRTSDTDQYQRGLTKIFFRAGVLAFLEDRRTSRLSECATIIQKHIRDYRRCNPYRRRYLEARQSILITQAATRGFLARQRIRQMIHCKAATTIQRGFRSWRSSRPRVITQRLVSVISGLRKAKGLREAKWAPAWEVSPTEKKIHHKQLAPMLSSGEVAALTDEFVCLINALDVSLPSCNSFGPLPEWMDLFPHNPSCDITFEMWKNRVFEKSHYCNPSPTKWEILFPAALINLVNSMMWGQGLASESAQFLSKVISRIMKVVERHDRQDTVESGPFWTSNVNEMVSFTARFEEEYKHERAKDNKKYAQVIDLLQAVKHDLNSMLVIIDQSWKKGINHRVHDWTIPAIINSKELDTASQPLTDHANSINSLDQMRRLIDSICLSMKTFFLDDSFIITIMTELMQQVEDIAFNGLLQQEEDFRKSFNNKVQGVQGEAEFKDDRVNRGFHICYNITHIQRRCFCCKRMRHKPLQRTMEAARLLQLSGTQNAIGSTKDMFPNLSPSEFERLLGHCNVDDQSEHRTRENQTKEYQTDQNQTNEVKTCGANIDEVFLTTQSYPPSWLEALGLKQLVKIIGIIREQNSNIG